MTLQERISTLANNQTVIIVKLNKVPEKLCNRLVALHNNAQMGGVSQLWAVVQYLTSICKD